MKNVLVSTLCLMTSAAWAGCERDDVDYYLSKGFTPDQITVICAKNSESAKPSAQAEASIQATPAAPVEVDKNADAETLTLLREAMRAELVDIVGDQLVIVQKVKVKYGEEDVFGNLPEVKPLVKVTIDLDSLRVIKVNKRIPVIRGASVLLSGEIQQSVVEPEQYNEKQIAGIEAFFYDDAGENAVKIKLDSEAPAQKVGFALQDLGERYRKR